MSFSWQDLRKYDSKSLVYAQALSQNGCPDNVIDILMQQDIDGRQSFTPHQMVDLANIFHHNTDAFNVLIQRNERGEAVFSPKQTALLYSAILQATLSDEDIEMLTRLNSSGTSVYKLGNMIVMIDAIRRKAPKELRDLISAVTTKDVPVFSPERASILLDAYTLYRIPIETVLSLGITNEAGRPLYDTNQLGAFVSGLKDGIDINVLRPVLGNDKNGGTLLTSKELFHFQSLSSENKRAFLEGRLANIEDREDSR